LWNPGAVDEPARAVFAARRFGGRAMPGAVRGVVQQREYEQVTKQVSTSLAWPI